MTFNAWLHQFNFTNLEACDLARLHAAFEAGQDHEREACATVCDKYDDADPLGVSLECANAIRARGQA